MSAGRRFDVGQVYERNLNGVRTRVLIPTVEQGPAQTEPYALAFPLNPKLPPIIIKPNEVEADEDAGGELGIKWRYIHSLVPSLQPPTPADEDVVETTPEALAALVPPPPTQPPVTTAAPAEGPGAWWTAGLRKLGWKDNVSKALNHTAFNLALTENIAFSTVRLSADGTTFSVRE